MFEGVLSNDFGARTKPAILVPLTRMRSTGAYKKKTPKKLQIMLLYCIGYNVVSVGCGHSAVFILQSTFLEIFWPNSFVSVNASWGTMAAMVIDL